MRLPKITLLAMVALALAGLAPNPASAGLTVRGMQLLKDGKQFFLRGSYYVQPAAYHHTFLLELDEKQMARDFRQMRKVGMNTLAIAVNWGDIIPRIDIERRQSEYDEAIGQRLRRLLECARKEGLFVNIWFGTARMPIGVPGCKPGAPETDVCGHKHAPYCGYMWQNHPGAAQFNDYEWRSFLDFHKRVAELTRGFDNVIFDPLDWQHLSMNYWAWGVERNLEAWRAWLRQRNPDLSYWNQRWGEKNADWGQVLFPVDEWVRRTAALLPGSPYAGRPDTPDGPKGKDFRSWHDGLCIKVTEAITGVLKDVRPDILIGQRVDIWHYGDFRQKTWAVGKVDFIFQGWYSEKPDQARNAGPWIARNVRDITARWPRPMPIAFWETGTNIQDVPVAELEQLQKAQLAGTERTCNGLHLAGWMWWTWRDYCMGEAAMRFGLVRVDGKFKPALEALPQR